MKVLLVPVLFGLLSACSLAGGAMPGEETSICEREPDACQPAATVNEELDGTTVRPPTTATLLEGDVTRIWIEPLRLPDGELTRAGYVYLE